LQVALDGELVQAAARFRALYRDHCQALTEEIESQRELLNKIGSLSKRTSALREELAFSSNSNSAP